MYNAHLYINGSLLVFIIYTFVQYIIIIMVIKCCVSGCANIFKKYRKLEGNENCPFVSFHRFPKNVEVQTAWIFNVRKINGCTWQPINSSRVCSEHFDYSSWEKNGEGEKRKLKFQAVPSIFNNLSQISQNDHNYSRMSIMKDITNSSTLKKRKIDRHELHSSVHDHIYASKAVSSDRNSFIFDATSIKKASVSTVTEVTENNITNIETESDFVDNGNSNIALNDSEIKKTSVSTVMEVTENNIPNIETESDFVDNGNSNIALNNSVLTNSGTTVQSNTSNIFSEMMVEVENAITAQTVKEQNIDIKATSLKMENEQLKKELSRIQKIADKILKQNETLRKSNKKLRRENKSLTNLQRKIPEDHISKILNKDQIKAIKRKNYQGLPWDTKTLKKALILKVKCGSSGYREIRKQIPLPSIRTLQRKINHIEFRPGILQETFDLIADKIKHNPEEWKDCVLALDEMAIEPGEIIDPSINEFIGKTTLASHSGIANKALVFLLGGITFRWKQSICFHLTGSKAKDAKEGATGQVYADIIKDIIERGEKIGLRIHCVVSDMGSDNRSMWRAFGIMANRSEVISSIPHPVRPSSRLHIMPDVPHLFKSIRAMIVSNKILYLSEDIVESENLPSNKVKLEHFLEICNTEAHLELKAAHRLRKENLDKNNHFHGMKVSNTKSVFCKRTCSTLKLMALIKQDSSYITTAWFVGLVHRWFELMTSRYYTLALNKSNKEAYEEAISHLKLTMRTFSRMRIGTDSRWKPVQCGVLIATNAILDLQDYFLNERGFKFVLTGRFTQDFLENLFSCIRFRQPTPNALMFKNILKALSIGQFCTSERGSYDMDDGEMLIDFLATSKCTQHKDPKLNFTIEIPVIKDENISYFSMWERLILYDMAGSALHSVKKVYSVCNTCYNSLLWQKKEPHPYGLLTRLNAYRDDSLTQVSEEAFKAIWKAELTFRLVRNNLLTTKNVNVYDVLIPSLQYVWATSIVPQCHNITTKLLHRYFSMRCKQFGQMRREQLKKSNNVHSSKSIAMHNLVK